MSIFFAVRDSNFRLLLHVFGFHDFTRLGRINFEVVVGACVSHSNNGVIVIAYREVCIIMEIRWRLSFISAINVMK